MFLSSLCNSYTAPSHNPILTSNKFCPHNVETQIKYVREVVKTTSLEQDPPNHKTDGGHLPATPHCLTSKDGVFVAQPPLYPAVENYSDIQTSLFFV